MSSSQTASTDPNDFFEPIDMDTIATSVQCIPVTLAVWKELGQKRAGARRFGPAQLHTIFNTATRALSAGEKPKGCVRGRPSKRLPDVSLDKPTPPRQKRAKKSVERGAGDALDVVVEPCNNNNNEAMAVDDQEIGPNTTVIPEHDNNLGNNNSQPDAPDTNDGVHVGDVAPSAALDDVQGSDVPIPSNGEPEAENVELPSATIEDVQGSEDALENVVAPEAPAPSDEAPEDPNVQLPLATVEDVQGSENVLENVVTADLPAPSNEVSEGPDAELPAATVDDALAWNAIPTSSEDDGFGANIELPPATTDKENTQPPPSPVFEQHMLTDAEGNPLISCPFQPGYVPIV
ncbi:unnamed protein product, partial [Mesorhabditis spiculigera]